MQVKKFEAPTMADALKLVKTELGPEAIILSTKNNRKGFGLLSKASVEVTAAVTEKAIAKKTATERLVGKEKKEQFEKLPATVQSKIYSNFGGYIEKRYDERQQKQNAPRPQPQRYADISDDGASSQPQVQVAAPAAATNAYSRAGRLPVAPSTPAQHELQEQMNASMKNFANHEEVNSLKSEMKQLKTMLAEIKTEQAAAVDRQSIENDIDLNNEFQNLLRNGIEKKFASAIIRQTAFQLDREELKDENKVFDAMAEEIMALTKVENIFEELLARKSKNNGKQNGPMVLALVGPTGVGKTTTIAKLASQAILQKNLRVGLINIDTYKVAALDQLSTYAKILNVPFRQASNAIELDRALAEFKPLDLVLIDTSGRSQKDTDNLVQMNQLLASIPNVQPLLIMSATTRDQELGDVVSRFKIFNPSGLVFSKLDECSTFGCILNVAVKTGLPLTYFTTGQRVPEDLENANKERLAALILDL